MVLLEIDLGSLFNSSNALWLSAILATLPLVLMVTIAVAIIHGNRVRKKNATPEGDRGHTPPASPPSGGRRPQP